MSTRYCVHYLQQPRRHQTLLRRQIACGKIAARLPVLGSLYDEVTETSLIEPTYNTE